MIPIFPVYKDPITVRQLKNNLNVDIVPYSECNLACPFCQARHYGSTFNQQWFETSIETLSALVDKSDTSTAVVSVAGGELFIDKYEWYPAWDQWFGRLRQIFENANKKAKITIVTNLMTNRVDDVIKLVRNHNLNIGTSFDFVGRWTKRSQVDHWWDNVNKIRANHITVAVAMIVHKPNLDVWMSQSHPWFDIFEKIYDCCGSDLPIILEHYVDANHLDQFKLTDDQIIEGLKVLVDRYPKIQALAKYFDTHYQPPTCDKDTIDVTPKFTLWSCCDKTSTFAKMTARFQCMTCRHLDRCSIACPTEALFHNKCIDRALYDYVDSKH